jgi:multimeric flavodoxin WrbA
VKVLGISGSLRADGNTEFMVKYALSFAEKAGADTEYVSLRNKQLRPCHGCYHCMEHRACRYQDDDFSAIFEQMKAADALIIGSPVYYSSVVPQLMALLDRAGFLSRATGEFFSGKVGGPITVARRAGHNMAFAQLLMWFFINDIIVPGSTYWNIGMAGAGGARDAEADHEGLATLEHFMKNLLRVTTALNGGPGNG